MFFVIAVHTSPKPLSWSPTFLTAFQMLLLTCNSNFYMMSGELNLQKRFEGPKDYKDYYVNKGISILFPYLAVTFFSDSVVYGYGWKLFFFSVLWKKSICGFDGKERGDSYVVYVPAYGDASFGPFFVKNASFYEGV